MHTYHDNTLIHGLADGCPRCDEHAADPMRALDDPHIADLIQRCQDGLPYRTDNEALAMNEIKFHMERARRMVHLGLRIEQLRV